MQGCEAADDRSLMKITVEKSRLRNPVYFPCLRNPVDLCLAVAEALPHQKMPQEQPKQPRGTHTVDDTVEYCTQHCRMRTDKLPYETEPYEMSMLRKLEFIRLENSRTWSKLHAVNRYTVNLSESRPSEYRTMRPRGEHAAQPKREREREREREKERGLKP